MSDSENELQEQLDAANLRADKWREICRRALPMAVYNSVQQEIEPMRPVINQQGFYKCCIEGLREIETAVEGQEFTCPQCDGRAKLLANTWESV